VNGGSQKGFLELCIC